MNPLLELAEQVPVKPLLAGITAGIFIAGAVAWRMGTLAYMVGVL